MSRILEDLFFGNTDPSNKEFCRDTSCGEAIRAVAETEAKLLALMDGDAKPQEAHVSAQSDLVLQTALEYFIFGTRIGDADGRGGVLGRGWELSEY